MVPARVSCAETRRHGTAHLQFTSSAATAAPGPNNRALSCPLGHHAEVYADLVELIDRPPQAGVIIASEGVLENGVAALLDRAGRVQASGCRWSPPNPNPAWIEVVEAIKAGALDFLQLPLDRDRIAAHDRACPCARPGAMPSPSPADRCAQAHRDPVAARARSARLAEPKAVPTRLLRANWKSAPARSRSTAPT